jgi:hypothetical protein
MSGFRRQSHSQSPGNIVRHRRRRTFRSSDIDTDGDTDIEHHAESQASAPHARPGASILSTLLSLYEGSGSSRHARSFDDSRPSSIYEMGTTDIDSQHGNDDIPPLPETPRSKKNRHLWKTVLPFTKSSQVEPSRKGPGVFKALVASTSNLSGAAAPTSSTVAPSLKRPGYHLSR